MSIKILGKESLIYGTGHVLARLITFLLLPIYTHVFSPEEYGVVSLAYAFLGFSMMFYRYGMDTALLKYSVQKKGQDRDEYISTSSSREGNPGNAVGAFSLTGSGSSGRAH